MRDPSEVGNPHSLLAVGVERRRIANGSPSILGSSHGLGRGSVGSDEADKSAGGIAEMGWKGRASSPWRYDDSS